MVLPKVWEALTCLLDNIYIRLCIKLRWQIVGIPMGTKCTPLVADLFLFFYEGDAMKEILWCLEAEIIDAFSASSTYLDVMLNVDNTYCDGMVNKIYPPELHLGGHRGRVVKDANL